MKMTVWITYKTICKDTKMVVDTRQPTAWERFISPVFQGVTQGAKASVEAK